MAKPASTLVVDTKTPTLEEYLQGAFKKGQFGADPFNQYHTWQERKESEVGQQLAAKYAVLYAPPPPKPAPDLADEGLANTRKAQLLRLLSGRGRRSTFLTGPLGSTGAASKPTLLGA
jgi:hypothetical protein